MKKLLLFPAFLLLAAIWAPLAAQQSSVCDSIYLKSGKVVLADIQRGADNMVVYKKCGGSDKINTVDNKDLVAVIFKNGDIKYYRPDIEQALRLMAAHADSALTYRIETTDGNEYHGTYLSHSQRQLTIRTASLGVVSLPVFSISRIDADNRGSLVNGVYWFENPHATRYFFAPNGYNLRRGEGYYQNAWILLNQVSYGISDHVSVGVGTIPVFLFGTSVFPVWATPKVAFPIKKDKVNAGAGVFIMNIFGEDAGDIGGFGIAYGTLTLGSRNNNTTFGMGYGFAGGDWASTPLITASGMYRLSRRSFLVTENYLFPAGADENLVILSVGGRWVGRRIAIDYGLFRPFYSGEGSGSSFIGLPWLSITAPFGKR